MSFVVERIYLSTYHLPTYRESNEIVKPEKQTKHTITYMFLSIFYVAALSRSFRKVAFFYFLPTMERHVPPLKCSVVGCFWFLYPFSIFSERVRSQCAALALLTR